MPPENPLTPDTWKTALAARLQNWRSRMQQCGVPSVYAFLSAATLWPVVEAVQRGEWAAAAALGTVAGSGKSTFASGFTEYSALALRRSRRDQTG